jgi:acyl-CoA hydrolase
LAAEEKRNRKEDAPEARTLSTRDRDPAIRVVLQPKDTNNQGTIFGGIILSYIDLAGAVEVSKYTRQRIVYCRYQGGQLPRSCIYRRSSKLLYQAP